MHTMRAKYRCNSVLFYGDPTNPDAGRQYTLTAVYDTGTEENRRFNKATPWGELKISVDNPAARLEVGEEYYLDFTKCSAAVALAPSEAQAVDDTGTASAELAENTTYSRDGGYTGPAMIDLPTTAGEHTNITAGP
jgi:hypothetical protein